ncbi:aminoglycoside phosphotransferase [Streptomyces zinciresistens K42]|uniref:Aminoglycoside phosphotransferase n=1 Tax=Streptomyces zinciresistens K42 TaxID=700597 RepID=G2GEA9_9ACTN|nr:phosphotransferase [Streptomyces zinciresistens]EGX58134.1 aminoglycoside phosphotransferase [Streptomyces zinciresistens K42]
MQASEVTRARAAVRSTASALGLRVDSAEVLHNSNKLTLRLAPCDVVARVAPATDRVAGFEVEVGRRLAGAGCPVAALAPGLEPRVHERDGFAITFWTYYEPVGPAELPPADYAAALKRLHTGMRAVGVPAPHFTDRVEQARRLVADRARTPALTEPDRRLLGDTLRDLGRAIAGRCGPGQLLHGEPHPGNLLATREGLLFIDLETCCTGPVEFDLAHAPEEVAAHCPGVDRETLRQCRTLVLAMITAWRWDRDDQLPDGRRLGAEWLARIKRADGT